MTTKKKADTNITAKMQADFDALRNPQYENFALFSCFVNGKPTAAIVTINDMKRDGFDGAAIHPLFVAVTDDMDITDHDGVAPTDKGGKE